MNIIFIEIVNFGCLFLLKPYFEILKRILENLRVDSNKIDNHEKQNKFYVLLTETHRIEESLLVFIETFFEWKIVVKDKLFVCLAYVFKSWF